MANIVYNAVLDKGRIEIRDPDNPHTIKVEQTIQFQHGPIDREHGGSINGVQTEDVLELLRHRLYALQERLPCEENLEALRGIETAIAWLEQRTERRQVQGVEGTNEPHQSSETLPPFIDPPATDEATEPNPIPEPAPTETEEAPAGSERGGQPPRV